MLRTLCIAVCLFIAQTLDASLHSDQTANHRIENWVYATAAARTGASGFVAADVGKVAFQSDTGIYYRLTATTPTWQQIGGSSLFSSILDTNGNIELSLTATASAVNYLTVANSSTSTLGATIGTAGTGTNLDITLTPKGTGKVNFSGNLNQTNATSAALRGGVEIASGNGSYELGLNWNGIAWVEMTSQGKVGWGASTTSFGSSDTAIARNAAGVVEINNGTAGTYRDLILRGLTASGDVIIGSGSTIYTSPTMYWRLFNNPNALNFGPTAIVGWGAVNASSTADVGLARSSSGVLEINNGTAGTLATLNCSALNPASVTMNAGPFKTVSKMVTRFPSDGIWTVTNWVENSGVVFDFNTDALFKLRNRANNADADVQAAKVISTNVVRLKGYTVSTLPAGTQGDLAFVTDATAPTYNGTLTGGGAVVVPVFYNGTAWVSH